MAIFPEITSVPYGSPVGKSDQWKTLVQAFESGNETRKQKRTYQRRNRNITCPKITVAQAQIYYQFFNAHKGGFSEFVFFDRTATNQYIKDYVGTGNGSTTIWNLPSKGATGRTLYVNDVAQTEEVDWTFTVNGGTDGEDKCVFGSAPTNGHRITFTFTGRLKIRCVFAEDNMDWEDFYTALVTTGLKLRGLLNT